MNVSRKVGKTYDFLTGKMHWLVKFDSHNARTLG